MRLKSIEKHVLPSLTMLCFIAVGAGALSTVAHIPYWAAYLILVVSFILIVVGAIMSKVRNL